MLLRMLGTSVLIFRLIHRLFYPMTLYKTHIRKLQSGWEQAMSDTDFECIFITAGTSTPYFLDDQPPPFRLNPHFAHWIPDLDLQNSILVIKPGDRPRLMLHRPDDFWHASTTLPETINQNFDVEVFKELGDLSRATQQHQTKTNRSACIGEQGIEPEDSGSNLPRSEQNPPALIANLHFQRAFKTAYEVDCLRQASTQAVLGHVAAESAFYSGGSEFEIHMAYLLASKQVESDLPYGNIVALNEHAATLHYQHYQKARKTDRRSFLIDAGARFLGYASDITRTYAADNSGEFAELIAALDARQQDLVRQVKPGISYYDLHVNMHHLIADILVEFKLVNCTADAAFDNTITDVFFPHGVGHFLGLQTHDVGGWLGSSSEFTNNPPKRFPTLRLTRDVEARQVFTIEPGIYFIPMLLENLRKGNHANLVNWKRVEQFIPFGGIRIEDNILVTNEGFENLTRNAFSAGR